MRYVVIAALMGLSVVPVSALAQVQVLGGVSLGFALGGDAGKRSDLNPHLEAEVGGIYGGVGAHVYNDTENLEIAPYFGYRNVLGSLSYDVSYRRSFLPNDGGDCCGGIEAALELPLGSQILATLDMGFDPDSGDGDAMLGAEVAAFDQVTLLGGFGVAGSAQKWELGASYALTGTTDVAAKYYDGSDIKPYLGVDLTWRFNLGGN
jgi:hypothetical protein